MKYYQDQSDTTQETLKTFLGCALRLTLCIQIIMFILGVEWGWGGESVSVIDRHYRNSLRF